MDVVNMKTVNDKQKNHIINLCLLFAEFKILYFYVRQSFL